MRIGKFVRAHIVGIFGYCKKEPCELTMLMDKKYSKDTFGLNFPFCMEVNAIPSEQASGKQSRFWNKTYLVNGVSVRVTNHWRDSQYTQFKFYLVTKKIGTPLHTNEFNSAQPRKLNPPNRTQSIYILPNKVADFEKQIGVILAKLAYHIAPKIVAYIQRRNAEEFDEFARLFADKIEIKRYLFSGSACVFPGVRRYVSGAGNKQKYNPKYRAIIDDNAFPRHLWCFLSAGNAYSNPCWKNTRLNQFELAHVFTHKETEIKHEEQFFHNIDGNLHPYGEFSCAANVVLLPKGTVRPTDNSPTIKSVFYKRYIDLYGESPLHGRSGFKADKIPAWANKLQWNEPLMPDDWQSRIDALLQYRTKRITQILSQS